MPRVGPVEQGFFENHVLKKGEGSVNTYRLILADDHVLFREGVRKILEERSDFVIVGEASDGAELLDLLKRTEANLILLDISMPNLRGIDVIPEIKRKQPGIKILILTMFDNREYVYEAIARGSDGYFLKGETGSELLSAIEKIKRGKTYVSPYFSKDLEINWEEVRRGVQKPTLTSREREVLKLIAEGKSNKEIGKALFISVYTVKRHRANIKTKMDLKNSSELLKYAIKKGYG